MRARFPSSPKAYRYDGSFDGFLCCVFESFLKKKRPRPFFRRTVLTVCIRKNRSKPIPKERPASGAPFRRASLRRRLT